MTLDVDTLPPTQYLVLDVLAARFRAGESMWTFPSRLGAALYALGQAGLVNSQRGSRPRTYQAWLTDAGRDAVLDLSYQLPVPTLATAIDTLPTKDEHYLAWMRRHGLGHGAGIATVISAVRADLRKLLPGGDA